MPLHPENTASFWLHDLAPTYSGDTITLGTAVVTVEIRDRKGAVVIAAETATLIEALESFRYVGPLPEDPGWYEAVFSITAGDATFTITSPFVVEAVTGAGS